MGVTAPLVEGSDEREIVQQEDGAYLVRGSMPTHEVLLRLGCSLPPAEVGYSTIGSFARLQLAAPVTQGESFDWAGWRFEIAKVAGVHVQVLRVARIPPGSTPIR